MIRNHYKGSKIHIILLIEYLKTRTLVLDLNHFTSKIDPVELECFYIQPKLHRIVKKLSHWRKESTNASFTVFFQFSLAKLTYMPLYSLKIKTLNLP